MGVKKDLAAALGLAIDELARVPLATRSVGTQRAIYTGTEALFRARRDRRP